MALVQLDLSFSAHAPSPRPRGRNDGEMGLNAPADGGLERCDEVSNLTEPILYRLA